MAVKQTRPNKKDDPVMEIEIGDNQGNQIYFSSGDDGKEFGILIGHDNLWVVLDKPDMRDLIRHLEILVSHEYDRALNARENSVCIQITELLDPLSAQMRDEVLWSVCKKFGLEVVG